MKKNKLFCIIILSFILCLFASFAVGAKTYSGSMNDNIVWSFDLNTGVLYIDGTGDMPDYPNFVAMPYSRYMTLVKSIRISEGITKIGSCAFMYAGNVTDVNIPSGVEKIGGSAFEYCTKLTNITLPDGISSVGTLAFANCTELKQVNFPASLTQIGSYAFSSCKKLTNVSLSLVCITDILEGTFSDCTSLNALSLPKTTESIGEGAFYNCTSLTSVSFPEPLSEIGMRAFFGCSSLSDCTFLSEPKVYKDAFYNTKIQYNVTYINYDGTTLYSYKAYPGDMSTYDGKTPTKPDTAQYSYNFIGWNPSQKPIFSDTVYTAQFSGGERTYTVTFYDETGDNLLGVCSVSYGNSAELDTVPSKESDAVYKYTFAGWDKDITNVTGDMSVRAVFEKSYVLYDVTFVSFGKSITKKYKYGEMPVFEGSTYREPDAQYTYEFSGWDKEITSVVANVVYTARYSLTVNKYTVTWIVDGTEYKETYEYGKTPSFENTEKLPDAQYIYVFDTWTPKVSEVTGDASYSAVFNKVTRIYSIVWNIDGTRYSSEYVFGQMPVSPAETNKNSAISGIYNFRGWSSEISAVTGEKEYKAQYDISKLVNNVNFTIGSEDYATVTANLSLSGMTNSSCVVTLSLYSDKGRLIGSKTVGANKDTASVSAKIALDDDEPSYAKAFVTDGKENLIPISASERS